MPEMTFEVRWPDGSRQRCYSPSLHALAERITTAAAKFPSNAVIEVGAMRPALGQP